MAVPPVATVYQRYCPLLPPDALSVNAAATQLLEPVVVGAVGVGVMNKPSSKVKTVAAKSPLILQRYLPTPKLPAVFTVNVVVVTPE